MNAEIEFENCVYTYVLECTRLPQEVCVFKCWGVFEYHRDCLWPVPAAYLRSNNYSDRQRKG